ncbi:Asp-tRNA(Asn)/Glu-tRNA(Gln) amidotransferase subunit GatC [Roseivirga sp. BDSF3-8]|uniref:Asp-tRNA(Asn)/Glu-tRNA(Gln) amidotransferase subunit GatC n=1 Tax=Roseivirga sp. BDSF3-8 TaxID=3241598 RepID=UPI0035324E95
MKIDKAILKKIAHLARLEFREEDEQAMVSSMTDILDWVEKLNELDTDNVEPLTNMSSEVNGYREDEVKEHLSHERALKNGPKTDEDYFRVPKVLD